MSHSAAAGKILFRFISPAPVLSAQNSEAAAQARTASLRAISRKERAGDLDQKGGVESLDIRRRWVKESLGTGKPRVGRRESHHVWHNARGQHSRHRQNVRSSGSLERQPFTVLLLRLRRILAGALALAGLVAAGLVLAGKHEVLFARDATAPQKRDRYQERQHRTGDRPQHRPNSIIPQTPTPALLIVARTGTPEPRRDSQSEFSARQSRRPARSKTLRVGLHVLQAY